MLSKVDLLLILSILIELIDDTRDSYTGLTSESLDKKRRKLELIIERIEKNINVLDLT